eukprot:scaffold28833_cov54-Phaeocystis_antarctica.AAC.1
MQTLLSTAFYGVSVIVVKGGAGGMTGYLRTTCCSQFDSNTLSEAQASEVSTVRARRRGRIFEILKSRKM